MPDPNILTRLLETPGFGWQCGEPLQDKGSYFRCSCGCSQPDADSDGYLTILQPKILREAAQEIERLREQLRLANIDNFNTTAEVERLRAERDEARRLACENEAWLRRENGSARDHAERMGWDCFKEDTDDR